MSHHLPPFAWRLPEPEVRELPPEIGWLMWDAAVRELDQERNQ